MTEQTQQDFVSKKRMVYSPPGVERVNVRREHVYHRTNTGVLTLDLYYPPDSTSGTRTPAVVFVTGFSDAGAEKMFGCKLKDMGSYTSWGESTAASGLVGITYTNETPATDVLAVLEHVRQHAASLDIDEHRIGLWACSGNAPTALAVLTTEEHNYLKCAVLAYPYLLDPDGVMGVAQAARQFGFANPSAGKSVTDLSQDVALFIARAGQDRMPGLNESLDRFLAGALARNLPLTFINHPGGPHAFDLFDDSEASREIIRRMLGFLRHHLLT